MTKISLVAAVAQDNVIAVDGVIPWHISNGWDDVRYDDLQYFRKLTINHPVIMGRKTFESIFERNKKPLPYRTNIVLSHKNNFSAEGIAVAHSMQEALEKAREIDRGIAFIIGGGQVYAEGISRAQEMYITEIKGSWHGKEVVRFPNYNKSEWHEVDRRDFEKHSFVKLERNYQKA